MRIYVYFLSLLLVIAPIYSFAVMPFLGAIAGGVGGTVAVGVGTAVIKKIAPNAQANLIKGALGVCSKNRALASFCGGVVSSIFGNGFELEVNNTEVNNTTNNDIDINIYRKTEGCSLSLSIGQFGGKQFYGSVDEYLPIAARNSVYYKNYGMSYVRVDADSRKELLDRISKELRLENGKGQDYLLKRYGSYRSLDNPLQVYGNYDVWQYFLNNGVEIKFPTHLDYGFYLACGVGRGDLASDTEITNIFNKLDGDDVMNIYNYDFSKHGNITVNNTTISGDTINNSKNEFDTNYVEKRLSDNATDKLKKKDKDYAVDKINDSNCSKNSKGEYDKCGKDKDKNDDDSKCKDDEVLINGECKKKKGDEKERQDEQIIAFCKE